MSRTLMAVVLGLLSLGANPARAADPDAKKEAALLERLRARIDAVDRRLDGVLGVAIRDLSSAATIDVRPDETFPAASSIKLAVLYELYRQVAEGRIELDETTKPALPRVGGSGVLHRLGQDVRLSWRDLAVLMMGWSDNEATNLLIRRVGAAAINRRLEAAGLTRTRLRREMMDVDAARRGEENVSTPRELARLVEIVAQGAGLEAAESRDLLAVASVPDEGSPFRAGLPAGLPAISKPGALEGVRCEAAFVDLPGRPYLAAIMTTYLGRDEDGAAAIREISTATFETFERLARSSEHGRRIGSRRPTPTVGTLRAPSARGPRRSPGGG